MLYVRLERSRQQKREGSEERCGISRSCDGKHDAFWKSFPDWSEMTRELSIIDIGGHVVPQHLLPTASHGAVRQASVGERFQLHIHAQASETKYRAITLINNKNKVESAVYLVTILSWLFTLYTQR